MVFIYDRKAIKKQAKEALHGSKPHFMLVVLAYVLLTTGVGYLFTMLTYGGGFFSGVVSTFADILLYLFSMVLGVGLANYMLRLSRKEPVGMDGLFEGFGFTGRSLGVSIMVIIYILLWSLLIMIAASILTSILMTLAATMTFIFDIVLYVICGIVYLAAAVAIILISLRYVMARFSLVEDPSRKVMDNIRRSRTMMKKNIRKMFGLLFSFVGWMLLIVLIIVVIDGLGLLLIGPEQLVDQLRAIFSEEDSLTMTAYLSDFLYDIEYELRWWAVLGQVLALPLTLWLTAYMGSATAVFYNHVSGFDFRQYMNTPADKIESPDEYYRSPSDTDDMSEDI